MLFSDADQRRILYSALLRQSRDTEKLREKALDKLILSALFGSSSAAPMTVGEIQQAIAGTGGVATLRVQTIQRTLESLEADQKVQRTTRRKKHAYFVDDRTNGDLRVQLDSVATLFSSRVQHMAEGTEPLLGSNVAAEICANFISECFGRYGRHIAETFVDDVSHDELLSRIDVSAALKAAAANYDITVEALALIESRCIQFLRSRDPEDQRLKFYVTQAYYFAQLLGLEEKLLRPLTDELFNRSVFYLDTNVVIRRLLSSRERPSALGEVQSVARRLGIELRVTRATINEARRVAAGRATEMEKVVSTLPAEIAERAHDDFLEAFLEAREQQPSLTVAEFLSPFDSIRTVFEESGVAVDETIEDDLISESDLKDDRTAQIVASAAEKRRGWPKTGSTLHHDVAHFRLIQRERNAGVRAYFLTQDGTLLDAAQSIKTTSESALTFSLLAFLQSVSPFVTAAEEEPFVDSFSRLLLDSLPPLQDTFDVDDLRVLTEIWDDIQSTPTEKIVEAYHYVRKELSSVGTQRTVQPGSVLLGLRKFISSSASEQKRALTAQLERERRAREQSDRATQKAADQITNSETEISRLRDVVANMQTQLDERQREDVRRAEAAARDTQNSARLAAGVTWLVGALLWWVLPAIARGVSDEYGYSRSDTQATLAAVISAAVLLTFVYFIRRTGWSVAVQVAGITVLLSLAILASGVLSFQFTGPLATALGLAAVIAAALPREPRA